MTLTSILICQVAFGFSFIFSKLDTFSKLTQLCQEIVAINYPLVCRWMKSSALYFQSQKRRDESGNTKAQTIPAPNCGTKPQCHMMWWEAVCWPLPPCTSGRSCAWWHVETYQTCCTCTGQIASTYTVNLTCPGHRLTLQIIFCETEGTQGAPVHYTQSRLPAAQGVHGRTGALWHISVHTLDI